MPPALTLALFGDKPDKANKTVKPISSAISHKSDSSASSSAMPDQMAQPIAQPKHETAQTTIRKLSQIDHVLQRSDMYIGSVHAIEESHWVVDRYEEPSAEQKESKENGKRTKSDKSSEHDTLMISTYGPVLSTIPTVPVSSDKDVHMTYRTICIVPGLIQIFDELLVNAADNQQRDAEHTTYIDIELNLQEGWFSVCNDGPSIPVERVQNSNTIAGIDSGQPVQLNQWQPELAAGELMTSSNFDDTQDRFTGGKNGIGLKGANIFAVEFELETVDSVRGLKYTQKWTQNMKQRSEPKIVDLKLEALRRLEKQQKSKQSKEGKPQQQDDKNSIATKASKEYKSYTWIKVKPDLQRFGQMKSFLDNDSWRVMERRVYDMAAITGLRVRLNGQRLPVHSFKDYAALFCSTNTEDEAESNSTADGESNSSSETEGRAEAKESDTKSQAEGQAEDQQTQSAQQGKAEGQVDSEAKTIVGQHEPKDTANSKASKKPRAKPQVLPLYYKQLNDRWQVVVMASPTGTFQHLSFVNAICTSRGGTHVDAVASQIVTYVLDILVQKHKLLHIKPAQIRNKLLLILNCRIIRPIFDGQSKQQLKSSRSTYGSSCELDESCLKGILTKCPSLLDSLRVEALAQTQKELKKTDGKKSKRILGIPNLSDANDAGGKYSLDCTLFIVEGLSAKTLVESNLDILGRDKNGIFPIKGKFLNVLDMEPHKAMKNEELANLIRILGLQHGRKYVDADDLKSLRYGHVMIMTDQDYDGDHIAGLLINLFASWWPELFRREGFLGRFITPLVQAKSSAKSSVSIHAKSTTTPSHAKSKQSKAKKQEEDQAMQLPEESNIRCFYNLVDYRCWYNSLPEMERSAWTIRYLKGLGSSTNKDAREYFSDLAKHRLLFKYQSRECGEAIQLAFAKGQTTARKHWLSNEPPGQVASSSSSSVLSLMAEQVNQLLQSYFFFVHHVLRMYSIMSNRRAIPSVIDGLKPGLRKILYVCFKRNLVKEVKVAQLAGSVAEQSAYHHGEASLMESIVGLAQSFVGSNNIPLLCPLGQFGSRLLGGKDAASPRYIFTRLMKVARALFPPEDDAVLEYLEDDGQAVEPKYYVPIIPMLLANGACGVGTGFATYVPNYNPKDLIQLIRQRLRGNGGSSQSNGAASTVVEQSSVQATQANDLLPWYRGFQGSFLRSPHDVNSLQCIGRLEMARAEPKPDAAKSDKVEKSDKPVLVRITELPIGVWTTAKKQWLEDLEQQGEIEAMKEYHTSTRVCFDVAMTREQYMRHAKISSSATPNTNVDVTADCPMQAVQSTVPSSVPAVVAQPEDPSALYKAFKLTEPMSTANMVAFDAQDRLRRFPDLQSFLDEFCPVRLALYEKRKEYQIKQMDQSMEFLRNKVRYIDAVRATPSILTTSCEELLQYLVQNQYKASVKAESLSEDKDGEDNEDADQADQVDLRGYKYLIYMPQISLTESHANRLRQELAKRVRAMEELRMATAESMWLKELDRLEHALSLMEEELKELESSSSDDKAAKAPKAKAVKKDSNISSATIPVPIPSVASLFASQSSKRKEAL